MPIRFTTYRSGTRLSRMGVKPDIGERAMDELNRDVNSPMWGMSYPSSSDCFPVVMRLESTPIAGIKPFAEKTAI